MAPLSRTAPVRCNMKPLLLVLFVLLIGFSAAEQVTFEKGLEIEVEDSSFHLTMAQNYTLNISQIVEYDNALQLGNRNISVYVSNPHDAVSNPRVNATLYEYDTTPPYSDGEEVVKVEISARNQDMVQTGFTGFRDLSSGSYILKRNGNQVQDIGTQGSFNWQNSSWSSHNYTVECDSSSDCEPTEDNTAPSVSASHSPSDPSENDSITVSASASDSGSGVDRIEIYFDGTLEKTCNAGSCSYDAGTFSAGSTHDYEARAFDESTNQASDSGSFTVQSSQDQDNNDDTEETGGSESSRSTSTSGLGESPESPEASEKGITLRPGNLTLKGEKGEAIRKQFSVTNNGDSETTVKLDINRLNTKVSLSSEEINLEAGETETVEAISNISQDAVSDGFSGELVAETGSEKVKTSLYLIVTSRTKDLQIDINTDSKMYRPGETARYTLTAYNLGDKDQIDTEIKVEIMQAGETVYTDTIQDIKIEDVKTLTRKIEGDIPAGTYTVRASTEGVKAASATADILNIQKESSGPEIKTSQIIAIGAVILLLAGIGGLLVFQKKRHERKTDQNRKTDKEEDRKQDDNNRDKEKHQKSDKEKESNQRNRGNQVEEEVKELKQRARKLQKERSEMKQKFKSGEITRQEYKEYTQRAEQEERRIKSKVEELKNRL